MTSLTTKKLLMPSGELRLHLAIPGPKKGDTSGSRAKVIAAPRNVTAPSVMASQRVSLRSQLGAHPGEEDRQSQSDGGENMTVRVLISPKRSVRVLAGLTQLGLGGDGIL